MLFLVHLMTFFFSTYTKEQRSLAFYLLFTSSLGRYKIMDVYTDKGISAIYTVGRDTIWLPRLGLGLIHLGKRFKRGEMFINAGVGAIKMDFTVCVCVCVRVRTIPSCYYLDRSMERDLI
ncbi:hypothetical protein J3F83DRAFT_9403 [Trichoderma novae-zelandiae]